MFRPLLTVFLFVALSYGMPAPAAESFQDCDTCPTMAVIPSGAVTVGSSLTEIDRKASEREPTEITIKAPFAMATTEVTLGQYREFVEATEHRSTPPIVRGAPLAGCNYYDGVGYGFVNAHDWDNPGYPQHETHPVVCVSWNDAAAYAAWLSEETGRTYRLPSATEFEYASRAGSSAPWHWGTESSRACEFANVADRAFLRRYPERPGFACRDGYVYTAPVAKFEANKFGLYDMVGNAWEWTADCWNANLDEAPRDGTAWLDGECDARVPKGGSWISGVGWARSAVRSRDGIDYRSFMLGFRVASDETRRR